MFKKKKDKDTIKQDESPICANCIYAKGCEETISGNVIHYLRCYALPPTKDITRPKTNQEDSCSLFNRKVEE